MRLGWADGPVFSKRVNERHMRARYVVLLCCVVVVYHLSPVQPVLQCHGTVCGVLVVESGLGSGRYKQAQPQVHGLWPNVPPHGTSPCIAPPNRTEPSAVYSCYSSAGDDALQFEQHEWSKHGLCAGVQNAKDFFTQVCTLSVRPLAIMRRARDNGTTTVEDFADALSRENFAVWSWSVKESQVQLSACRQSSGIWILAPPSDFETVCGSQRIG